MFIHQPFSSGGGSGETWPTGSDYNTRSQPANLSPRKGRVAGWASPSSCVSVCLSLRCSERAGSAASPLPPGAGVRAPGFPAQTGGAADAWGGLGARGALGSARGSGTWGSFSSLPAFWGGAGGGVLEGTFGPELRPRIGGGCYSPSQL